ncbi:MAG: hypothetical protein A3A44_02025 [Candidatus Sungbacteria bacterium RIFCSPLOWO2_01_FULL_60_25]|uniref:Uncharacterized protein n=1 Tax=Candidatus Sungbacteria bacterium RIFCSPLOWO2_01_FULL_60_25 TaxID=1802281 RepID=A0A1G2LDN3_9BACT|nr:MAG: hypothetical protein A3A44_02025 [Candidatus Sungbacteria bacterium RIFCSPLOWO2_01_FULL_60_25]
MEHETAETTENGDAPALRPRVRMSIAIAAIAIIGAWAYQGGAWTRAGIRPERVVTVAGERGAARGTVTLPVRWGDLGVKMVSTGVIDRDKLEALYAERGGLDASSRKLLASADNENLMITKENSGLVLNLLWALGLGAKNAILEKGPMADPAYGGAGKFASTGGWTLAAGEAMEHYSRHPFIVLTPQQQALVERVAKNIYRPCCNNSTYFPDCNHGMAMLGLLELMASQGVGEEEMYRAALRVNELWFPDTYATIATYLAGKGIRWENADPKEILGASYSSASGYQKILSQVTTPTRGGGNRCGVQ